MTGVGERYLAVQPFVIKISKTLMQFGNTLHWSYSVKSVKNLRPFLGLYMMLIFQR